MVTYQSVWLFDLPYKGLYMNIIYRSLRSKKKRTEEDLNEEKYIKILIYLSATEHEIFQISIHIIMKLLFVQSSSIILLTVYYNWNATVTGSNYMLTMKGSVSSGEVYAFCVYTGSRTMRARAVTRFHCCLIQFSQFVVE